MIKKLTTLPAALNIEEFLGLSTDVKPVSSAGSTFYCLDTQEAYISDGAIWWVA